MAVPTKQYGLILPQKKGASKAVLSKPSIFGDDSDEETSVGESLQKEAIKKKMMKQTRLEMQKALDQDSTVYDYDGVYDDIQKQRLESNKKTLGSADRRPKYIHQLMKAVDDRKKEQERRDERKIQKEREAEGEKFADKDAYVTSAYKKKLEELKEEQEMERRQAEIEAALDVRKQKDLSGFHRHLLNQIVGEEAIPDRSANKSQSSDALKETETTTSVPSATSQKNNPSSGSENEEGREEKTGFIKPGGSAHSNRQYRQRSPSSGSEEERGAKRDRDRKKKSHKDKERERHRDKDRDKDRDRHRGRERDDRYGDRRSDKDRRKDRDRGREDDRSRGRGEAEREDRHRKRERSPKEREREKNGERENRRNSSEDKRKDKPEEEKERKKEPETQKVLMPEEKDAEKQEGPKDDGEQKEQQEEEEERASKFAKRSTEHTVSSARDRYLARQMARSSSKSYIEKEED